MAEQEFKELILQASFDEIERLEPYLEQIRARVGFDEERFPQIRLAVNEAVTNAIVHGNKEDATKKVHISARRVDDVLQISVKDEGEGFDPASLPDPLQEENLLKESGRGIFLIRECTDQLKFSEDGTRLILQFNL